MKSKNPSSWVELLKYFFIGASVTVLVTFGCGWCRLKLWGNRPPVVPKTPPGLSCPMESPSEPETDPEDEDSLSLAEDSQGTHCIEGPSAPVLSLEFKERKIQKKIREKIALIRELKIRDRELKIRENEAQIRTLIKELILIIDSDTRAINYFTNLLREEGVPEEEIKNHPEYPRLDDYLRKNHIAQIVSLDMKVTRFINFEAQRPTLEASAASPGRKRPAPKQIRASSSSTRTTKIRRVGSRGKIGSPGPSDSELSRIGSPGPSDSELSRIESPGPSDSEIPRIGY